jgi:dTMP kinase
LEALEQIVHPRCRPDLTIILDLDPASGAARRARRRDEGGRDGAQGDRYEERDQAFQERLRKAFLSIAADEPERCRVVDAGQDVDAVHDAIWRIIGERFGDEVA